MFARASFTSVLMLVLLTTARTACGASGWKPVSAEDLKLTAESIGEPGADAAILLREGTLDDEGETGTTLQMYIRIKIFTDAGRRYADVQLPYRVDLVKISDVHARTVRPDGSTIAVEGRDIFDKVLVSTSRNAWRAKTFSLPSVAPGSIIEYRYRQTYRSGFRYFELDLQSELFIKELVYKVQPERSSALDLLWVTFNARDHSGFVPKWDGTYNIRASNIQPFRREPYMPPEQAVKMWGWLYYAKDSETDPEKYWRQYGQAEYERQMDQTRPTRIVRRVVDALIAPAASPDRRIARIYAYIESEIRNVGPREIEFWRLKDNKSPEDTLGRRYGTERDINRLFISMLRAAGIDARAAQLTSRDDNFFHYSFPNSVQFDAEVTAVIKPDGQAAFYDPGTSYCPPGVLAWDKQGVQALIPDKETPRFVETPVSPAAANRTDLSMDVTVLSDGRLKVSAVETLSGLKAVDFRLAHRASSADAIRKAVAENKRNAVQGAVLDDASVSISGLSAPSGPISISYSFVAPAFAPPTQTRILLRPALLGRRDETSLQQTQRINAVYFHYPWSETDRVVVRVPPAYAPEQLPEDVVVDIGAAKYQSSYRQDGDEIVFERSQTVNGFFFEPGQYDTLKSFFDQAHQDDRTIVSLKR